MFVIETKLCEAGGANSESPSRRTIIVWINCRASFYLEKRPFDFNTPHGNFCLFLVFPKQFVHDIQIGIEFKTEVISQLFFKASFLYCDPLHLLAIKI